MKYGEDIYLEHIIECIDSLRRYAAEIDLPVLKDAINRILKEKYGK